MITLEPVDRTSLRLANFKVLQGTNCLSVVSVKCYPDRPVKVNDERWASIMATTMTIFFDCRTYTATFKDRDRVDYNFYGTFSS